MIRKILVPLDESPRAAAVLEVAVELAERFGASLRLFRVITIPQEWPAAAAGNPVDRLSAYMAERARAELERLTSQVAERHVAVELPLVRTGAQPWKTIVSLADELAVDLIVIGSHGYHGLDHVLGTNAGRVANFAHRNVLVVHSPPPLLSSPSE